MAMKIGMNVRQFCVPALREGIQKPRAHRRPQTAEQAFLVKLLWQRMFLVRSPRFEPGSSAWQADVLDQTRLRPPSDTQDSNPFIKAIPPEIDARIANTLIITRNNGLTNIVVRELEYRLRQLARNFNLLDPESWAQRASVKYSANQKPEYLKTKLLKEIELKLIVELLKGSRRSDRELAKRLGVSQPTVTRARLKLEKEGKIKEYTIIPDFASLGFQLMSVTFLKLKEPYSKEARERMKTISQKLTENYPAGTILAMGGMGMNSEHVVVTYHKNYSEYHDFIKNAKSERAPLVVADEIKSFLVDLNDKTNFLPLTLSHIARVLPPTEDEWKTREKEVTSA